MLVKFGEDFVYLNIKKEQQPIFSEVIKTIVAEYLEGCINDVLLEEDSICFTSRNNKLVKFDFQTGIFHSINLFARENSKLYKDGDLLIIVDPMGVDYLDYSLISIAEEIPMKSVPTPIGISFEVLFVERYSFTPYMDLFLRVERLKGDSVLHFQFFLIPLCDFEQYSSFNEEIDMPKERPLVVEIDIFGDRHSLLCERTNGGVKISKLPNLIYDADILFQFIRDRGPTCKVLYQTFRFILKDWANYVHDSVDLSRPLLFDCSYRMCHIFRVDLSFYLEYCAWSKLREKRSLELLW
jgi:hypothetical protein